MYVSTSKSPIEVVPVPDAVICTPNWVLFTFPADHRVPQRSSGPPRVYTVGVVFNATVFGVPTGKPARRSCTVTEVEALENALKVIPKPEMPEVKATAKEKP